jgi:HAMP domain-containing protein
MSLLMQNQYLAAADTSLLIALSIATGFILVLIFVASIRRRVLRQQKQLELLRQDVAALRLAEEKRFLKELNRPRTNALGQYPVLTKAPKIAARS